ncbi:hypothetical protein AX17_000497 [Amanita inopinata Kibby_2008]|nr:hypothetical protein AX17_000497 [Amanita inopinata Kibby_2008]
MPSLDSRGIVAAAQIGFYVPVAVITVALLIRYALRPRTTDGALIIAAELAQTKSDLYTPAYTLQAAGLAPLMLATVGFIGLVGQHTYSETPRISHMLRALGLLCLIALGLTIAGDLLGSPVNPTRGGTGLVLRRVAACVFAVLYIFLVLIHFGALSFRWYLRSYRRKMLLGLFLALPALGARAAYAVLEAWSSSDLYGRQPSPNPTLARVNPATGRLVYYLVLSVIVEFVVTLLYLFFSTFVMRRRN